MRNLFSVVVMYDKMNEQGEMKRTKEQYLVNAVNCSDAEQRATEECIGMTNGEFRVVSCSEVKYNDLFLNGKDEKFFKCKMMFITLDEKSGKEKAQTTVNLVEAINIRDALRFADEEMKGSMMDYCITSLAETSIMGIIGLDEEQEPK